MESIQDMLTSAVNICQTHISPLNKQGDRQGCTHNKDTKKVSTPKGTHEAYKIFVENGFLNAADVPEAGGLGTPDVVASAFTEMFSSANQAFIMYGGLTKSASHVLWNFGSPWMKKTAVPKLASGQWTGTMCLTEPGAGSAVGDLRTVARGGKDGTFFIKGTKQWISGGDNDFADNVLHLVLARIEGAPAGIEGVSLFLVPKIRFHSETGINEKPNDLFCISLEEKMGIHGNATCLMSFGDNNDCEAYLIGQENKGIDYMFLMMNEARMGVGLQGLGLANAGFLNAQKYALERVQGVDLDVKKEVQNPPRVTIVHHPDVKRMLLRQRALVEGCRALCYMASFIHDLSLHSSAPAEREKQHHYLELLTPIVKAWCTDMGYQSLILSMQTFGGYGYTKDYPIEQLLRDCKIASIYEGTNGIQALDFVGRKMRMLDGMVFKGWLARYSEAINLHRSHPALGDCFQVLEKNMQALGEGAMSMAQLAKTTDKKTAMANAYPFMMAFGHISVCGLLLEQALVASEALSDAKVSASNAKFYRNKIKTAQFFAHHILPEARAYLASVSAAKQPFLDFEFE